MQPWRPVIAAAILVAACTAAAAQEPDTLSGGVALFREGQAAPPHQLLGVVYMHRWSLPAKPAPEWRAIYDLIARMARKQGADMVVEAVTGEEDPLIENGNAKWFLGLAARSIAAGDSAAGCDNCIVDWSAVDSSSAGTAGEALLARVERRAFAVSRLRLAEAGYYLRDVGTRGSAPADTSTLRLEVRLEQGPTKLLASPENIQFASRLVWNVSGGAAWKRNVLATTPSSHVEESGQTIRNALVDLYSSLAQRGPTPDSDGDGVPDSRDREFETRKGAEVDFCGKSRDDDGDGVPNGIDRDPFTPIDVAVDQYGRPADADGDGIGDYQDECPGTPREYAVDGRGCPIEEWVTVLEDALVDRGLLRERFPFELGSARLNDASRGRLDTIGIALSGLRGLRFRVEGHCDDQGGDALNDTLSAQRARAVIGYLVQRFPGLERRQFTAHGWGKRRPLSNGTDEASRALNRRVEFVVENPDEAKRLVTRQRAMRREESSEASPDSLESGRPR